jgi:hypothetical protein
MASDAAAAKHGVASSTRPGTPAQLRDLFVAIGATVSIAAQGRPDDRRSRRASSSGSPAAELGHR